VPPMDLLVESEYFFLNQIGQMISTFDQTVSAIKRFLHATFPVLKVIIDTSYMLSLTLYVSGLTHMPRRNSTT